MITSEDIDTSWRAPRCSELQDTGTGPLDDYSLINAPTLVASPRFWRGELVVRPAMGIDGSVSCRVQESGWSAEDWWPSGCDKTTDRAASTTPFDEMAGLGFLRSNGAR